MAQLVTSSEQTQACALIDRHILKVSGEDRLTFLEGLLTQTVLNMKDGSVAYGALLTPQGKVMSSMILYGVDDDLYLELEDDEADTVHKRLMMYKLRAAVEIEKADDVAAIWSEAAITDALITKLDPRHADLGYRSLVKNGTKEYPTDPTAYNQKRYVLGVPEGKDIEREKDFWLETDAERLNGVSFSKGCYVGQELTARMKHRTSVKKKIVPISSDSPLPAIGTEILLGDKLVGDIRASEGNNGLAFIRLERVGEGMTANGQAITLKM